MAMSPVGSVWRVLRWVGPPVLGLIVPEIFQDSFSQLRSSGWLPIVQFFCAAWIVFLVCDVIPVPKTVKRGRIYAVISTIVVGGLCSIAWWVLIIRPLSSTDSKPQTVSASPLDRLNAPVSLDATHDVGTTGSIPFSAVGITAATEGMAVPSKIVWPGARIRAFEPTWSVNDFEEVQEIELVGKFINVGDMETVASISSHVFVNGQQSTDQGAPARTEFLPNANQWSGPLVHLRGIEYAAVKQSPETVEIQFDFLYPDGLGNQLRMDYRIRFFRDLKIGILHNVTERVVQ